MKPTDNLTPEFPIFVAEKTAKAAATERIVRLAAIAAHLRSLDCCWPEWTAVLGGRCQVGYTIVHSITHNERRYHYMALCIIREIRDGGETFIVEVDYPPGAGCDCDKRYNGEMLRLDITEIWAPVRELNEARDAAENQPSP